MHTCMRLRGKDKFYWISETWMAFEIWKAISNGLWNMAVTVILQKLFSRCTYATYDNTSHIMPSYFHSLYRPRYCFQHYRGCFWYGISYMSRVDLWAFREIELHTIKGTVITNYLSNLVTLYVRRQVVSELIRKKEMLKEVRKEVHKGQ